MWKTGGDRYKLKKSLGNGYVFSNRATLRSSALSTSFDVLKPNAYGCIDFVFKKPGTERISTRLRSRALIAITLCVT